MFKETFVLRPEHIKLLKRTYWSWNYCEFGAPTVDPKRPYGNSDVFEDMIEILELENAYDEEDEYGEKEVAHSIQTYLIELHEELETAMQVIVDNGFSIVFTTYNKELGKSWIPEPVEPMIIPT